MEEFDMLPEDDELYIGLSCESAMQMYGVVRSPEFKACLYLRTRVKMVMRLRGCSYEEALRYVEERNGQRKD